MWDNEKKKYEGRLANKWYELSIEYAKGSKIGLGGVAGCVAYGKAISEEQKDRRNELLESLGLDETVWNEHENLKKAFTRLAERHVPGISFVGLSEVKPQSSNRPKEWDEEKLCILVGLVLQRVTNNISENGAAKRLATEDLKGRLPLAVGKTYVRRFREAMASTRIKARVVQMQKMHGMDWADKMILNEIRWDAPRVSLISQFYLANELVRKVSK